MFDWSLDVSTRLKGPWKLHISKWDKCSACGLSKNKRIYYRGTLPARLILCGEHSGESESVYGMPFVGEAGRLLDKIVNEAAPGVSYLVCNLVLCIPPRVDGSIRSTLREERMACVKRIEELIDLSKAEGVVAIGEAARVTLGNLAHGSIVQPSYILRLNDQKVKQRIEYRSSVSRIRRVMDAHCREGV